MLSQPFRHISGVHPYMLLNCGLFLCSVTTSFSFGWLVYKHCWSPSIQYYILVSRTAALSHSESI